MNLTIEQAALAKALARVTAVVERRNTIPVLSNVLIQAQDGEAWLSATDLDMESRVRVEADVAEAGEITAEAGLLSDIVRNAPTGAEVRLTHSAEDPRLVVVYGRSRFKVPVLPPDLFPKLPDRQWEAQLALKSLDLRLMLERVAFAMCTDGAMTHLHGAYLHSVFDEGRPTLRLASTDKYRVAFAQTPAPADAPVFRGVIIPAKAVREFVRALGDRTGDVVLSVCETGVRLEWDDSRITSKVLEGQFLDYQRVIPSEWKGEVELDNALMAAAVRRVSLVSNEKARSVKLTFAENLLTLQVRSMEAGEAVEEIEIDYDGPTLEVGFNARYLLEGLGQTEADVLAFRFNDASTPARLEPIATDPEHGAAVAILMPLRV